jgi:IstB-like ATP binding protein
LAIAIARSCIRAGSRGRFFNTVDLVNRLEAEGRSGRQGRLADYLTRLDLIVLDELGYLPFAQAGGQLLFHLISRLYERTSIIVTKISPSVNGPASLATQSDHLAARPPHASLRHRRNRQRELALQEPRLIFSKRLFTDPRSPRLRNPTSSAGASAAVSATSGVNLARRLVWAPWGGQESGGCFDRRPGIAILELLRAEIAQR